MAVLLLYGGLLLAEKLVQVMQDQEERQRRESIEARHAMLRRTRSSIEAWAVRGRLAGSVAAHSTRPATRAARCACAWKELLPSGHTQHALVPPARAPHSRLSA